MSNEQNTSVGFSDDLDAFSLDLYGQSNAPDEQASSPTEDVEVETEDADALNENKDTQAETEDDALDPEDSDEETDEDEEEPEEVQPKPKKNRFQERIDELTGKARTAEREAAELRARMDVLISRLENKEEVSPNEGVAEQNKEPSPDDLDADGEPKYPLGEFDKQYLKDLTKHQFEQLRLEEEVKQATAKDQMARQEQANALQAEWNAKLETAQERYPDYLEKGQELVEAFSGIDQAYGDYLTATIMSLDNGPDVFYHLSKHPELAKKIVESGATKATVALGKIDARFDKDDSEDEAEGVTTSAPVKATKAPPPPPSNRGAAVSRTIQADTDNLDDFEKLLFKKTRKT